ncbi:MAG: hypothetical protein H7Z14_05535 [Anaerolineae bacterium]|nr:hypothetical protein [Phycisphaerae bacterium]
MMIFRSILGLVLSMAILVSLSPVRVFAAVPDAQGCCKTCQKPASSVPDDHGCGTADCAMQCCRMITVVTHDVPRISNMSVTVTSVQTAPSILHTLTVPDSIFHPPRI